MKDLIDFCKENHLNVQSTDPQWKAICSDTNTVVSAGAGTGKTTVLSFRFLRIVAERKAKPSEILTITFTRKATAEMKSRIYILLQDAYKRGIITEDDLKDFSNSTISTVDSFCSEIVRKNSVSVGVSRDFTMLSEEENLIIVETIVNDLLKQYEETFAKLLTYFSMSNILQIFEDISVSCLNIAKPFDKEEQTERLKQYLYGKHSELVQKVRRDIDYILPALELKQDKKQAIDNIYKYIESNEIQAVKAINENWDSFKNIRKDNGLKNLIKEDITQTIPACIQGLNDIAFMEQLTELVKVFETKLFEKKREKGLLSFEDIMQLTLKILTENKEQRQFYKKAFKYIMIDEFQDNNDDYRKLLFLLSEDENKLADNRIPNIEELSTNKIFLVGDQKQSIYKFRGAEVDVFKKMTNLLCREPIELKKNWRSEPQIINFCNDVFNKIMDNKMQKEFEADFSSLETRTSKVENSRITILKAPENEQEAVARLIDRICSQDSSYTVYDDSKKATRIPRFDDIGILLKSSSSQGKLEKALNSHNIPFTVTEPKTLMKEALVNDFYSALMAVLNPKDMIAYASFLKSPFCCVKDKDLSETLQAERPAILENLKAILTNQGLIASLTYLWNDCGYRSYIQSCRSTSSYSQHFDWLFSIACDFEKEGKSIVEFTDYLRSFFSDEFKKLPQQTVFEEETRGVQIMTIHKSKGLSFPIVIVCGCDATRGGGFFQPENTVKQGFISMRYANIEDSLRNPVEILEKPLEEEKEDAETKRVLYVAATRPKNHLFFSASVIKNDNSMMGYLANALSLSDETEAGIYKKNGYDLEVLIDDCPFEERLQIQREKSQILAKTVEIAKPIEKVSVTSLEEDIPQTGVKLPALESDCILEKYNISNIFGTRVHSILEASITGNEEQAFDYPKEITQEEITVLERDSHRLADNFLQSKMYINLKAQGAKFECEKPLVLYLKDQNQMAEGRIDLLCMLNDSIVIIDFKTDRYKTNSKHFTQLELYKTAIKKMPQYKDCSISTEIVYLRDFL